MAKKIKSQFKLNLPAGAATPAPPVGPVLGQHGVAIMDFVKRYNDETADKRGQIIPAIVTVYEDKSFTFVTMLPPVAELIKKKLNLQKGSGKAGREKAGKLSAAQLREIAEEKMKDLNAYDIDAAMKVVAGAARSMGVEAETEV
ncbi:50S ribosomal protein L11 [Candidatus Roizmanbacteria bacterium RIFCSPLOWO2_02_FULL_43_10]|uniref:Large ribosomal subunit protein uL11 n=3 Tax=Candidatus Roizmaniibacteriota TaxID=1752723 RepID=A0A1F7JYH9_9BACT|nr:MAG: 50S ribosomal protein L11 [Candidatus Roizmanbacteria bacterium RIFCSPHIGHO2_02_FULL_43_11]OGK38194.1 MAG: 50S ribosomal protein L11 [Candidatus Roizmanbacteria bacterium RIFCSPHIGHO2_12_FULL_42_10]OGK60668.1 MAG: 50S ribosomal protein L11 [Candidatus Roizmanbacteria bacterium RIFCSPLOWO2_02_FULL_43_10]